MQICLLVLICKFLVVANFLEWWLVPTTVILPCAMLLHNRNITQIVKPLFTLSLMILTFKSIAQKTGFQQIPPVITPIVQ